MVGGGIDCARALKQATGARSFVRAGDSNIHNQVGPVQSQNHTLCFMAVLLDLAHDAYSAPAQLYAPSNHLRQQQYLARRNVRQSRARCSRRPSCWCCGHWHGFVFVFGLCFRYPFVMFCVELLLFFTRARENKATNMAASSSSAAERLRVTLGHLKGARLATQACAATAEEGLRGDVWPEHRQDVLKWNGWGYRDSFFKLNDAGLMMFTGTRYELSGEEMPQFRQWMEDTMGMDVNVMAPAQERVPDVAAPIIDHAFLKDIEGHHAGLSTQTEDRLFHSHGHTCEEMFVLRHGTPGRVPDAVVWPGSHANVEAIVAAAAKHNICIIPFGGGTTVTGAVQCPENEHRMIVSLDMTKMSRILWVDEDNMVAHIEAGIVGVELEKQLAKLGVCTGHEPDSSEFSTLGGWVATRASGMKKNVYGNIEDLVVRIRFVTPTGTIEKSCQAPRISAGPDIHQFILGSEGVFGVVTEVTMKVRKLPEAREYGSIVFPDFTTGVACLREIAEARAQPASIRLVDNDQFVFGRALKPRSPSIFASFMDSLKTFYVTKWKGFEPTQLCVATLLFEGSKEDVARQQQQIYAFAAKHKGLPAGAENGKRGYFLTWLIAYLRDIGLEYKYVSESFETSAPWSVIEKLCRNVKDRIVAECKLLGVANPPLASCRVTQSYDAGACVYFYYGFSYDGLADPLGAFHRVEVAARDEVLANGGCISHHHGVGKIRQQWLEQTLSSGGVDMLRAVKRQVDPQNIMGAANLIPKAR
eukprot:m.101232 g.101232  ORF g.101232 m.101232 type:complete len:756 (-) comp15448_c0_seq3:111-2378(-)